MLFRSCISSNVSNTRKSVSSDIQTLRSGLKKQGTAELLLHRQAMIGTDLDMLWQQCDEVKMLTCVCITMMDEMEWRPGLYVSMLNGMHSDLSVLCFGCFMCFLVRENVGCNHFCEGMS